jgi:hypothetical protein
MSMGMQCQGAERVQKRVTVSLTLLANPPLESKLGSGFVGKTPSKLLTSKNFTLEERKLLRLHRPGSGDASPCVWLDVLGVRAQPERGEV